MSVCEYWLPGTYFSHFLSRLHSHPLLLPPHILFHLYNANNHQLLYLPPRSFCKPVPILTFIPTRTLQRLREGTGTFVPSLSPLPFSTITYGTYPPVHRPTTRLKPLPRKMRGYYIYQRFNPDGKHPPFETRLDQSLDTL